MITEELKRRREKQRLVGRIVQLHKKGYTSTEIANACGISESFVRKYVKIHEDNKDRV